MIAPAVSTLPDLAWPLWSGLFDQVVVLTRDGAPPPAPGPDPSPPAAANALVLAWRSDPVSHYRAVDRAGDLDAMVIAGSGPAECLALYFLWRRRLRPPGLALFVSSPELPGAGLLCRQLQTTALLPVARRIEPLRPAPAGLELACELPVPAPSFRSPPGRAPHWSPPAAADEPDVTVQVILPALRGFAVVRWYDCYLARSLPLPSLAAARAGTGAPDFDPVSDPIAILSDPGAVYLVEASLPALIAAVTGAATEAEARAGKRAGGQTGTARSALAAALAEVAADARGGVVWGMGSDLLRAVAGQPDLLAAIAAGRLRLADRQQAGRRCAGHPILAPERMLTDDPGTVVLSPAAAATRRAMIAWAASQGGRQPRWLDPYRPGSGPYAPG